MPGALDNLTPCCAPYLFSVCGVLMLLSELWDMTDAFITGAPCRRSTDEDVVTENITVWPLFTLEPDILTGIIGFTRVSNEAARPYTMLFLT